MSDATSEPAGGQTGASTRTTAETPDGVALAVTRRGAGEPLLLIAGQALSGAAWDPVVGAFAASYEVITYDHRGTGDSPAEFPVALPEWTTRDVARDALAVLDGLGVDRAHVYGHSMGGRTAMWLAADAPERVGALVLGGTTGGDRLGAIRDDAVTQALASGDADVLGPLFFTDEWLADHPDDKHLPMRSSSVRGRRAHYAASQGHDAWDVLGRITAPTLVLHAEDDEVCPVANARLLAEAIPGAELEILTRGRHVYYAGEDAANAAVLRFLTRHPLS